MSKEILIFLDCLNTNYITIKCFVWVYGISTIVDYLMPNPVYTYILNIYYLIWFYDISAILGYLMPNPFYT